MNNTPAGSPPFAVNRAAILSRIRGVHLSKEEKNFSQGRPRLEGWTAFTRPVSLRVVRREGIWRPGV